MKTLTPLVAFVVLSTLSGCAETPAPDASGFDAELKTTLRAVATPPVLSGCGDVFVYGATSDDRRVIEVTIDDELAYTAAASFEVLEASYTLPDPRVSIVAKWGEGLTRNHCDDHWTGHPTVVGEVEAIAGQVSILIEPTGVFEPWEHSGRATIQLDHTIFESPMTGQEYTIDLELPDVMVGWYPG